MSKRKWLTILHLVPFGKYKGKPVQFIVNEDPMYLKWAHDNSVFYCCDDVWDRTDVAPEPGKMRKRSPNAKVYSKKNRSTKI